MKKLNKKYSIHNTDYSIGQDNIQKWGLDTHNPVFAISASLIFIFLAAILLTDSATSKAALDGLKWDIIGNFDSFFMWSGNFFVLFCLALIISPYGKIRIGGKNAKPDHSTISWLAMLFAAGMGIGLMFWSVAEPVAYLTRWYKTPIVGVTCLAALSVVRGLDGGVKILSNINMLIAFVLLVVVASVGFAVAVGNLPTTVAAYLENIIPLSNPHGREDEAWFQGWTVFYWAWWISWSPFVGMFIARISSGRTVREFMISVLLVPTFITLIWMSIYGGIAIDQVMNGVGALGTEGLTDVSLAMFQMFDQLPMNTLLSVIAIILVLVFFVTSSDSGSLVIDSITAGGKIDAPVPQRIFWVSLEGAIAAVLLWVGGTEAIQALQAGAISTGLPFTFVLLLMCVSLIMGFRTEKLT